MSNVTNRRLDKLEIALSKPKRMSILETLESHGADGFELLIREHGEDGVIWFLTECINEEVFGLECLRGIYPDHLLATAYNKVRNYAFQDDIRERVRQLAGLYQEDGALKPEYVRRDNGLINDA